MVWREPALIFSIASRYNMDGHWLDRWRQKSVNIPKRPTTTPHQINAHAWSILTRSASHTTGMH